MNKNKLIPELRFPEFVNEGEWDIEQLGNLSNEISEKTQGRKFKLMSITSGIGLVSQFEKFGREIAGNSYVNYLVIRNGDFAYNKSSTKLYSEGEIALYEDEQIGAVPNSIFTCFRFNTEKIYPRFAKYPFINNLHGKWLKNFIAVGARANGALQVNNKDLFSIPFPYPKISEQQKIASCLSSLDELIVAHSQKLEHLKDHKKGLMQNLFPQEGEKVPKFRFPEFKNDGEWNLKQLGVDKLIEIKGRIGYRGYTIEDIVNKGKGAISMSPSNIDENWLLNFEKSTYISWDKYEESPEIMLNEGFTVLVKTGSSYGKAAYIKNLIEKTTINPQLVVLKPKKINSYFLYLLVTNSAVQKQIQETVVGGAIPTLSQDSISKFEVLVPNPKEQQKIANCLSALNDLIIAQTQRVDQLNLHKKGLMQGLFPKINE